MDGIVITEAVVEIVRAYVSNHQTPIDALPVLIDTVRSALTAPAEAEEIGRAHV